jgi:hypothetical protein
MYRQNNWVKKKKPEWLRYPHQRKWPLSCWKCGHMYRKWERNEPPVTIYSPHFLPSTWCSTISIPFNVDHTYGGIWKDSFHQSWNLQTETVTVIIWMCQSDFGSFWSWITGSESAYIIGTQAYGQEQCKQQKRHLLSLSTHGVCTLSTVSASRVECGAA